MSQYKPLLVPLLMWQLGQSVAFAAPQGLHVESPAPVPASTQQSAGSLSLDEETARQTKQQEQERRQEAKEQERLLQEQEFEESIEKLLPVEPSQIRRYLERKDDIEGAMHPDPAKMRSYTRSLRLLPGEKAQVIHLTAGYSSTLLFQDASGAPWPILSLIVGNAQAFQATQPRVERQELERDGTETKQAKASNVHSHMVNIVPLTNHASSNLVLTLEDAPYPVILHLKTESSVKTSRINDALVVFRLEHLGPQAKPALVGPSVPRTVSKPLLDFVHGIAPQGAKKVRFTPHVAGVELWLYEGSFYLRSLHQAVWPAWTSRAGTDGYTVYVMPKVPSLVVSIDGQRVRLVVQGEQK